MMAVLSWSFCSYHRRQILRPWNQRCKERLTDYRQNHRPDSKHREKPVRRVFISVQRFWVSILAYPPSKNKSRKQRSEKRAYRPKSAGFKQRITSYNTLYLYPLGTVKTELQMVHSIYSFLSNFISYWQCFDSFQLILQFGTILVTPTKWQSMYKFSAKILQNWVQVCSHSCLMHWASNKTLCQLKIGCCLVAILFLSPFGSPQSGVWLYKRHAWKSTIPTSFMTMLFRACTCRWTSQKQSNVYNPLHISMFWKANTLSVCSWGWLESTYVNLFIKPLLIVWVKICLDDFVPWWCSVLEGTDPASHNRINSVDSQQSIPKDLPTQRSSIFDTMNRLNGNNENNLVSSRQDSQGGANVLDQTQETAISLLDGIILPKKLPALNIQYGRIHLLSFYIFIQSALIFCGHEQEFPLSGTKTSAT